MLTLLWLMSNRYFQAYLPFAFPVQYGLLAAVIVEKAFLYWHITPLISMGVEAVMCTTDELISLCYEDSKLLPAILFSL